MPMTSHTQCAKCDLKRSDIRRISLCVDREPDDVDVVYELGRIHLPVRLMWLEWVWLSRIFTFCVV